LRHVGAIGHDDDGTRRGLAREAFAGEGDNVRIICDLVTTTPAGSIPCAGWYRVRDGKISSVRAFFDARPLTQ
jgi:hypothetical protein